MTTKFSGYGAPDDGAAIEVIDAMGATTAITRDLFGNVTQLTQSGTQNGYSTSVTRQFWYDGRLRLCRHRAPEFGDELFAYDALDRLQMSSRGEAAASGCATPSAGIRNALAYDALDRVTATDFAGATPDAAMTYDGEGNLTSSIRMGGALWTYQYNALNAISQEKLVVDARTYQFDYAYDGQGSLYSRSGPGGTLGLSPDAFGRPTGVSVAATPYVSGATYHANGLLASASYANGFALTQTLDARQKLFHSYATRPGSPTATSLLHYYDARGKIVTLLNWAVAGEDRSFSYDPNGRLASSTGPWGSGSYVYDALGNLRSRTEGSMGSATISYDATNRVSQSVVAGLGTRAHVYDARGNTLGVGGQGFTYDFSNQPVALYGAVAASYDYDANLKRVKEVRGGKTIYTIYSRVAGGLVFKDEATDGETTAFHSAGGASVRLVSTGGGAAVPTYIHGDHLGSPVAATNAAGSILWRESYNPFGAERINPAANDNSTGFTGHLQDSASGLTYMQARTYDPILGRFYSTDPIGYQDQLDLYAYVHNDPVNMVDPTGEEGACFAAPCGPFPSYVIALGFTRAQMVTDSRGRRSVVQGTIGIATGANQNDELGLALFTSAEHGVGVERGFGLFAALYMGEPKNFEGVFVAAGGQGSGGFGAGVSIADGMKGAQVNVGSPGASSTVGYTKVVGSMGDAFKAAQNQAGPMFSNQHTTYTANANGSVTAKTSTAGSRITRETTCDDKGKCK